MLYEPLLKRNPNHFLVALNNLFGWDNYLAKLLMLFRGRGREGRPPYEPVLIYMHEQLYGVDLSSIEQVKTAVRYNVENNITCHYRDLAKQLYSWTDIFRNRFLNPIA